MIELIRTLGFLLYCLLPKRNHAVIYGWPDGEDNMLSLEHCLQSSDIGRVFLLMKDVDTPLPDEIGSKTSRVIKNSPIALLWFFTARYVFFTHRCFMKRFPKSVTSVNVWHGMPIKKIGALLKGDEPIESSHVLATSPFWSELMKKSMCPHGTPLIVGLPRNDQFSMCRDDVFDKLDIGSLTKLLVWLPTYRRSVRGAPRQDGHEHGSIFELPDVDPDELNDFLEQQDAFLIIKPHPMAIVTPPRTWSRMIIINDDWILEKNLSLYRLLGASDILITDISSVLIDYLLIDKPVIHAFPDIDAYKNSRGFSVEPIEDYFAGEVVSNQEELIAALETELSGKDPHAQKRRALRDLSHTHQDNKATERLLEAIGLKADC